MKLEEDALNPTQTTNLPPSFSNYNDSDDNDTDEEVGLTGDFDVEFISRCFLCYELARRSSNEK